MKKTREYLMAVLFFSSVWGISEAVLGDTLYRLDVAYASVPLSVIGFVVLTFARVYFPKTGTATLIAACAMLYKFLNAPFFGCHLLGILLMGACYDLFFAVFKMKSRWLAALAATYLSHTLFALTITYVFRYDYWVQGGFGKVLGHVGIGGSIAAVACAVVVPLSFRLGERLKRGLPAPFAFRLQWAAGGVSVITIGLWALSVAACVLKHLPIR